MDLQAGLKTMAGIIISVGSLIGIGMALQALLTNDGSLALAGLGLMLVLLFVHVQQETKREIKNAHIIHWAKGWDKYFNQRRSK